MIGRPDFEPRTARFFRAGAGFGIAGSLGKPATDNVALRYV
jgi:hypothetical protein